MDAKNIIRQKIEKIKNNVEIVLEKYSENFGTYFLTVEKIKNEVEKTLWLAVENYETPNDLPACDGEFENDGNRFLITLKNGDAVLMVYVYMGDLVDGYDEENIQHFDAFDVEMRGNFLITKDGWLRL